MIDYSRRLKEEPGFLKLFMLFKQKYYSLGRVGGTVDIDGFTDEEVESIAGLIGQSPQPLRDKGKIHLASFEQALKGTVFANCSLVTLMETVLGEKIVTKNEEQKLEEEQESVYFRELLAECPEGEWWWEKIQSKSPDTRWIWALYRQDPHGLFVKLTTVFSAFQRLSVNRTFERLPLFAQRTTGNPHFFDYGRVEGNLLSHCLITDQLNKGVLGVSMPKTTEDLNDLLSQYGLMRDDLWSFVTCRGLLAETEQGIHPLWKAAVETGSVLNVPLKLLVDVQKVRPAAGKKVWIVENSSVCSAIVDEVSEAPIICTHGQFRTASWLILDLLYDSGCTFYYSGDLDPEGITMAQRLKNRYGDRVIIWRMDKKSYEEILSDEDVSDRLSKIEAVTSPDLLEVADLMRIRKKAGYQEGLVTELVGDILKGYTGDTEK
ncbi:TIGR02679 family protein [Sporosarcina soli]|uniref:TIGR02679 family protein n=1 Tax=Sporosarcina soli TaxID=334736 RepID=A0ABW0TDZ6_9BACL